MNATALLQNAPPLARRPVSTAWFSIEEWQEESGELHPETAGPLEVTIAADYLHKANISGGAPYWVWLPHTGADPLVRDEVHGLTLTDYLRRAFAEKGSWALTGRTNGSPTASPANNSHS